MNPESWGFIGTIIGAIVGASASIITTRINSKNAIRIQEDIERNARHERYREFQRNNLLELQEKLTFGMRLMSEAYLEDLKNYKKSNKWKSSLLAYEFDQEIANSFREISLKAERVANDELRNEIIKMRDIMADFGMEKTREDAEQKQIILINKFRNLMPQLGKILRENY